MSLSPSQGERDNHDEDLWSSTSASSAFESSGHRLEESVVAHVSCSGMDLALGMTLAWFSLVVVVEFCDCAIVVCSGIDLAPGTTLTYFSLVVGRCDCAVVVERCEATGASAGDVEAVDAVAAVEVVVCVVDVVDVVCVVAVVAVDGVECFDYVLVVFSMA